MHTFKIKKGSNTVNEPVVEAEKDNRSHKHTLILVGENLETENVQVERKYWLLVTKYITSYMKISEYDQ